jgi:BirA family biotin operon repressor/biotin-[acetyl-CoA-carboxylase] ligase
VAELPPGWRLEVHASLPSTQEWLIARARDGAADGLAVLAHEQTEGRGTGGRRWEGATGNLHLSVLLRPTLPGARPGAGALMMAVALADAVARHAPESGRLTLKWPNDLLLDGRKLAGILTDASMSADGRMDWMVVGFGVNLAEAPSLPDRRAASLTDTGLTAPSPEEFAVTLLWAVHGWRRRRREHGFAAIRAAWLARAHPIGTQLVVRVGTDALAGDFAGLSDAGHLLLSTHGVVREFVAGEVSHSIPG